MRDRVSDITVIFSFMAIPGKAGISCLLDLDTSSGCSQETSSIKGIPQEWCSAAPADSAPEPPGQQQTAASGHPRNLAFERSPPQIVSLYEGSLGLRNLEDEYGQSLLIKDLRKLWLHTDWIKTGFSL